MMALNPEFQFSQSSLHDYEDCARRFQLRYVDKLAWPAVEVEPALENEQYMQQGAAFHRLVQQHILGLPVEQIEKMARGAELQSWWRHYLAHAPQNLPARKMPEITLSAKIAGYHLIAKYDLLALDDSRAVIVDWKTTRHRPKTQWLTRTLQTRVYRYVLARAGGAFIFGRDYAPEQISMVYWFANAPTEPEILPYSATQFQDDEAFLQRLIREIETQTTFPKTDNEKLCQFCVYRGLCGRAAHAGTIGEMVDWLERDEEAFITLNTKMEIEF